MFRKYILTICFSIYGSISVAEPGPFEFKFVELASGVWAGVRPDSPRFPVMGNTTFVISEEGVVVFDGGGMPLMAEQVIEKVRSITDKPVTHVIISHWHGDHNFGIYRFAEEFANVQFIAHSFTDQVINSSRITYIDRQRSFIKSNMEDFQAIVKTGSNLKGIKKSEEDRNDYARIIEHAELIDREYNRARVTPPNILFDKKHTIQSGSRKIELLHLGHANTAGDIVMWLPDEGIVSTGDIVVLPAPYAFNVPPRAWSQTLQNINALKYKILIPGHGAIQKNTAYVDLLIEAANSIADQRDILLAQDKSNDEVMAQLDFSEFEERFTKGDAYVKSYYDAYFVQPFRKAAIKALSGQAMVAIEANEEVGFDDERWKIEAAEFERVDYLGQSAIKIRGGAALLPDLEILNGVIEFDLAISETRGFAGLMFRVQDEGNFEHFYIRPHQSGNPDANQYTPVFNGVSAWQLYYGEKYASPIQYRFDEWMHIKIVFAGTQAMVYIDSDKPVLHIRELKRGALKGAIGLHSAAFSEVHFANLEIGVLADAYTFPALRTVDITDAADFVTSWQVSDTFSSNALRGVSQLNPEYKSERTWKTLNADSSGVANLARIQGLEEGKDTVFARFSVSSEHAQIKELAFGYSDRASVYVNGERIYSGDNGYMTRDYRYLGTIGLFDRIHLQLQAGENEVVFAVSEAFGGWGVLASVRDFEVPTQPK